ncbi:streptomycin 6-phosphotransferase [Mycolicibacterium canariasense]|uniref:Streptomycin 6-phosphotransferase n=1 Tax=Mycolicibacterium canariasense TaxID=228230 RepID=A0A117IBQ9_MYCCR|nr:hypothetical protein [Mycolicibacterium canariasense]MCV7211715.1 hypothetical protein [Mycolicibacterium canariasense]GAS98240.1 streptomycin 6-phosphotransferase [Mycolicibacterium canariasense]
MTTGESAAFVLRDADRSRYAKVVSHEHATDLADERDHITWLGDAGIPVGAVLDWPSAPIRELLSASRSARAGCDHRPMIRDVSAPASS